MRDDEREAHHDDPADAAEHVGVTVAQAAGSLVDMGLEEAHHRSHQVPCEINRREIDHRPDRHLVAEQQLDVVDNAGLLAGTFLGSLGCIELRAFLKLALEVPGYEGHNEEGEEHQTGTENLHGLLRHAVAAEEMGHLLHEAGQEPVGGQQHTQKQDAHGPESPGHLGDADVAAAVAHLGVL